MSDDPYTVHNLAGDPEYEEELTRLREANRQWIRAQRDLGFIPEGIIDSLRGDRPLTEAVHEDEVPLDEIIRTAEMASMGGEDHIEELADRLNHADPSVRFWAAMGLAIGHEQASSYEQQLLERTDDPSGVVRVALAEALYALEHQEEAFGVLGETLAHPNDHVKLRTINFLETVRSDPFPSELTKQLQTLVGQYEGKEGTGNYVHRAASRLVEE